MKESILVPEHNCWKVDILKRGALLIDSADFYRAVHAAICSAKESIFILGWDIDSGTKLLRGEDEKNSAEPSVLIDLLTKKAQENPMLNIYILVWDSSVAFVGEREFLPELVWTNNTPLNIHFHLDDTIPLWGSHHQKIILIDDELVFSGGMDLARQRWDERDHKVKDALRNDPNGPYGPFHDVQIMMDGPIVKHFSDLVRFRWRQATGYEACPLRTLDYEKPATSWPSTFKANLNDMSTAIARTFPGTDKLPEIQEVHNLDLDLFKRAKNFIYIENQYFTSLEMAQALNQALQEKTQLKALLVSSYDPQGIFESAAMWAKRIDFKRAAEKNISPDRIRFVSSGIRENNKITYKRIHSKILIIDDLYCVVGSANLTDRSMVLDSECDVILEARNQAQQENLEFIRNDLIAEHTGRSFQEVQECFLDSNSLLSLLEPKGTGYRLWDIEDSQFTGQNFQKLASSVADPESSRWQRMLHLTNPRRVFVASIILFLVVAILVFSFIRSHVSWFSPSSVKSFLEFARASHGSFFIVCAAYVLGGFVLFPVTLMSLITAAVFGSLWGPIYGMTGALLSAAVMFTLGRWMGLRGIRKFIGDRIRTIDAQFRHAGVFGVTILRLIPIAPYSVVNIAAGISSVRFIDFMLGTFLGFLPAFIVKGVVGDSLAQVFINPTLKTTLLLVSGLLLWLALTVATFFITKRWRRKESTS